MEWSLPILSDSNLQVSLDVGERLFVVGPNGSGKSAFLQFLVSHTPPGTVRRISAHRQTWLESGSVNFTPHSRRQFEQNVHSWDRSHESRWKEIAPSERQNAAIFDLIAKENARAREIARLVEFGGEGEARLAASKKASPFRQVNELLGLGNLEVALENSNDEEILAQHGTDGDKYSIAQMSDGERNAAIISATALTVDPGTLLLIDEPERHLHRSIIEPFLSALFEQRSDCMFVVSTHEVALPVANQMRTCSFSGVAGGLELTSHLGMPSCLPEAMVCLMT